MLLVETSQHSIQIDIAVVDTIYTQFYIALIDTMC